MIMKKKKSTLIAILLMIVFSFSGFLVFLGEDKTNLASVTLIIGIVFYFVTRDKEDREQMSLKACFKQLKDWKTVLLTLVPLLSAATCYLVAKMILPEFLEHLKGRIDFLSFGTVILLIAELIIAAFGEEIAWRGFFQNKLSKSISFLPALLIQAVLFSFCHFTVDRPIVVLYDLFFIVVDAVLFGLIFKRTNNIIVSTFSHFIANFCSVLALLFIF